MSHVPPLPPPLASITHAGDHDANRELYHGSFTAKVQRFMVTNVEAFNDLAEEVTLDPLQDSEVLAPHKESCQFTSNPPLRLSLCDYFRSLWEPTAYRIPDASTHPGETEKVASGKMLSACVHMLPRESQRK